MRLPDQDYVVHTYHQCEDYNNNDQSSVNQPQHQSNRNKCHYEIKHRRNKILFDNCERSLNGRTERLLVRRYHAGKDEYEYCQKNGGDYKDYVYYNRQKLAPIRHYEV